MNNVGVSLNNEGEWVFKGRKRWFDWEASMVDDF